MSQETCSASPFSALSYQEQQARWLEWRSRQLDYRPAAEETETPRPESSALAATEKTAAPTEKRMAEASLTPPPVRLPGMASRASRAPNGRRELNQVLSRHAQAARRAGAFQTASPAQIAGNTAKAPSGHEP